MNRIRKNYNRSRSSRENSGNIQRIIEEVVNIGNLNSRTDQDLNRTDMERINRLNGLALLNNFFEGEREETAYFFKQFDEIADLAQWTSREKLTILKTRLKGNALRFMMSNHELNQSNDYEIVKCKLLEFFGEEQSLTESQIQFSEIHMLENEDIKNFAYRVTLATDKYLGNIVGEVSTGTKEVIDKLRLSKFLGELLPELQRDVLRGNPKNFEEAVKIAKTAQMALNSVAKYRINAMGFENKSSNKTEIGFEPLTQQLGALNANSANASMHCLACGSRSHFIINCNKFQELMRPQQIESEPYYGSQRNSGNQRGNFNGYRNNNRGYSNSHNRPFRGNSNNRGRGNNGNFRGNNQSRGNFVQNSSTREEGNDHFLEQSSENSEQT